MLMLHLIPTVNFQISTTIKFPILLEMRLPSPCLPLLDEEYFIFFDFFSLL